MDDDTPAGLDLADVERAARVAHERWAAVEVVVADLRVERASSGGEVSVTVDGRGLLVDVAFGERVRLTAPERLATMLLTTLRGAQGALAGEVADAVAASGVARDAGATRALLDGYRRRFPQPAGEVPPADDPSGGSWLR